jgi:hypothetical protein
MGAASEPPSPDAHMTVVGLQVGDGEMDSHRIYFVDIGQGKAASCCWRSCLAGVPSQNC